jgi:hypothetical protein
VHVWDDFDEPLGAKMPNIHLGFSVSAGLSLQFVHIDHSKRANGRQCSDVGFAEEILASSASHSFAVWPTWQIQSTAEDIAGIVSDDVVVASASTQPGTLTVTVAMIDVSIHGTPMRQADR